MYILVAYDVQTTTAAGRKRLQKIAKICTNHGQRVQNSVFECDLNSEQLLIMKNELLKTMDVNRDSIRIYKLGKNYERSVEHYGSKESYRTNEPIIF